MTRAALLLAGAGLLAAAQAPACSVADGQGFEGSGGDSGVTSAAEGPGAGTGSGMNPGAPLVASAIAAGRAHTCALLPSGEIACWGAGDVGQLGSGSGPGYSRPTPVRVPGIAGAVALDAGGDTTCALLAAGGTIVCWGSGAYGQLGDGSSGDGYFRAMPAPVTDLAGAIDVSVAGPNVCAVLTGGHVRCWGRNDPGEWLGFASPDCGPYTVTPPGGKPEVVKIPCQTSPEPVPVLADAVRVAAGGAHTCALRLGGRVSCWGADAFGQLGDGQYGPDSHSAVPSPIDGLLGATALALGDAHTCAIRSDHTLACWGDNAAGQLGTGTDALDSYKTKPYPVPDLGPIAAVAASGRSSCAALVAGGVSCWGDASALLPKLPDPGKSTILSPSAVPSLAGAAEVRTGAAHACARRGDGTVVCWGSNDRGQLGNGGGQATDFSLQDVQLSPAGPG